MLTVVRMTVRHYRELILAGAFAALAAWETLEMLLEVVTADPAKNEKEALLAVAREFIAQKKS